MEYFFIALGVIVIILLFTCIRIVPQSTQFVIERLGKFKKVWDAGIHLKVPFIERIAKTVTLKEQLLDTPPQPVITSDNVTMQIDAVVYYRVYDSKLYSYGAVNPIEALANMTATTLRNIVGEMTLDQSLTSREAINNKMAIVLDEVTDPWGIKVTRVEIKNINPPKEIREAMEKEMKAERNKRQTLLEAEAHREAVKTRAQGDKEALVLEAEGERDARIARAEGEAKAVLLARQAEADGLKALKEAGVDAAVLELKKYETLTRLADGKAAKIIVPTDVVDTTKRNILFSEMTELGNYTAGAKEEEVPQKPDACCDDDPTT